MDAYLVEFHINIKFDERQDGQLYYSDKAVFRCADGYHYKNSEDFVIECISGGRFSDANPACKGGNSYW